MRPRAILVPVVVLSIALASPSVHAGGPITSGSTVAGSVANPTYLEQWTFAGTAGQRIIVTAVTTSGAMSTNIFLKAPGGATETSTSADRLDWQLAATGSYTIEIQDVGLNDAGNYALGFVNVTAGPYTSGGDLDGGAIVSADVKTGTMSGVGDIDVFTFAGTNGNRVLIDAVATGGAGFNTTIFLYPPSGAAYLTYTPGDRIDTQLTSTGTWAIVIEDNADDTAGSYSMSLLNVTAGPHENGGDTDGSLIASNDIVTGQFQQGVDFDAFTFAGTAGRRVIVTGVETGGGSHNTQMSIYPPGGGAYETLQTANRFDLQLLQTGTYTIVVEDVSNDHAGTYTLSLMDVTAGPYTSGGDLDGGAIVSADVKTGTMSGVGDIDVFTFAGTNGNRVLIDAVATGGAGFNTTIFLYPPSGAAYLTYTPGDRIDTQLTSTGTWAIVIEDNADDTAGSYSMSLLNVTAGPHENGGDTDGSLIASNDIVTGQFQQGVDFDAFTFAGTAGRRVIVTGVETGGGSHNTQMSIYPPGGGAYETLQTANRFDLQLLQTGTYTIVVEDVSNDHTGTYTLSLMDVTAGPYTSGGDLDGGAIVSADVKTGTMSGVGDIDVFTFAGTNGNRVLIDAVATGGAGFNTTIFLYPPSGAAYLTYTPGDRIDTQLTSTGTWAIVIEDNADDTAGSYSMSLLNVTAGPHENGGDTDGSLIASNDIVTGQFQQGVDFDAFTFAGTAGRRVIVTGVETGGGSHNTQMSIYPPGGGAYETLQTANRFDLQLLQTGTYTIVVEDVSNDHTGTYTLSLMDVTAGPYTSGGDLDGGAIVSADVKTGTMSGVGDIDVFTFAGTNGNRVLIDAVATGGAGFNTTIFLYPPSGAAYLTYTPGDRIDTQLTSTGTWAIVIEDNADDTAGSYSMSLLNVTAGPHENGGDTDGSLIASNDIVTGQFQQGVDFDAFTFAGTAGRRVIVTGVETGGGSHNTQMSIYPPGGGAYETLQTANRFDLQLLQTGTYTIVVEDVSNDHTGTYTLSLMDVTAGPYTSGGDLDGGAMVSADVKTGTMSGVGDIDVFTFAGTNGNRVLIDAVATGGAGFNTTIFLYPPSGAAYLTYTPGDRIDTQLTSTGTWAIVIEDNADDTAGSYSMSLLNVTAGPRTNPGDLDGGTILSNQIKTGQFQQGVDFDAYTFNASVNHRVIVSCVETGGGVHNTQMSIYPPGGGAYETLQTVNRFDLKLLTTGIYTIVVEDVGNDHTGTYTLSFVNATSGPLTDGSDTNGGTIVSNDILTGTMSGVSDIDAYQFYGTNGSRVIVSALATGGAGFNTTIYLYAPLGGALGTYTPGDRLDYQLTSSGTWTITIEDNANDTPGDYSVSFLNSSFGPYTSGGETDGGPLTVNTPVNGSAIAVADVDGYTFYGLSGQTANITATVTSGAMNSQIWLYPPSGGASIVTTSSDIVNQLLSVNGYHTIVIEDVGQDQTGNYTLTLGISGGPTGVGDTPPAVVALLPAFPSPFANSTTLGFDLPATSRVRLSVYDVRGARVRTLMDENRGVGSHAVPWDGRDDLGARVASGVYYVQFEAAGTVKRQKIVLVR